MQKEEWTSQHYDIRHKKAMETNLKTQRLNQLPNNDRSHHIQTTTIITRRDFVGRMKKLESHTQPDMILCQ